MSIGSEYVWYTSRNKLKCIFMSLSPGEIAPVLEEVSSYECFIWWANINVQWNVAYILNRPQKNKVWDETPIESVPKWNKQQINIYPFENIPRIYSQLKRTKDNLELMQEFKKILFCYILDGVVSHSPEVTQIVRNLWDEDMCYLLEIAHKVYIDGVRLNIFSKLKADIERNLPANAFCSYIGNILPSLKRSLFHVIYSEKCSV